MMRTELQKMLAGQLYDPSDPELVAARKRARDLFCSVRIGSFTQFGPGVQLYAATHPLGAAKRRQEEFGKPIDIGPDVWVGGGAIILPGVSIGAGAVIGAGSVVTRDIAPRVLAAGNPCRVLRSIDE